ncbi:MAG: hypothetical protein IJ553_03660 [Alloprevotella sp.]|nr:hypothetical protein [Alloprevotella sp.]
MKDNHLADLAALEYAVNQLLEQLQALKAENLQLKEQLVSSQAKSESLHAEKQHLQEDYERLKLAKMLDLGTDEVKDARQRVDSLIRKVDRCISLIKA